MSIPSFQPLRKRKRFPKYYGFHTFADPGCPILLSGPFRDNIRIFLHQCAELEGDLVDGNPIWCTFLVHERGGFVVPLFTVEEHVKSSSPESFCDHCRCAGWSRHFVSKRKYHVIIPSDEEWKKPPSSDVLDLDSHLLHGLIHCNGFGHLLSINGIEGGSKRLCGREIMDLWDRICSCLHTRKITAQDVSKKHKMDLRLLHGVAYGHPWFGRWGYRFLCGSFGVKDYHYHRALELLSSLELDKIIQDLSCTERCKEVRHIIRCYRDLSETNLITLRDIFRFMLALKFRAEGRKNAANSNSKVRFGPARSVTRVFMPSKCFGEEKSGKCRKFSRLAVNWDSRWPVKRLEFTANVIVEALKLKQAENNFSSPLMNRQEVRDAARQQIGDTGLIDYVLKSLNNVVVGDYIVRRMVNKATRKLEYTIEEVKKTGKGVSGTGGIPQMIKSHPTNDEDDVYADVSCLYDNVLLDHPESEIVKAAARTVLNSKYFVKEWPFRDEQDHTLRFICRLLPSLFETETELSRDFPTGEYIVVPLHSTIKDLKLAIQNAMRDTYCITSEFVVTDIEGTEGMGDDELIFGFLQSGLELWVRGYGLELETHLKYEGGADNWKVNCKCGAQDDDGERMIACDMCEVWHHTYCCGIEDSQAVPSVFTCDACYSSMNPTIEQPIYEMQYHLALMPSPESNIFNPDSYLIGFEDTDCLLS